MRREIAERVARAIEERIFPGCVIGVLDDTEETAAFGYLTYEQSEHVTDGTVYDLASITKSIPVASLALLFAADKKLSLGDRAVTYIPELQNHYDATLEDLLRYRVRGMRMSTIQNRTFEEIRTRILEHGFDSSPDESAYTNLPAFLLGIILERVDGSSLPSLAHRYFFEPLEMDDTTFFPSASDCAPTEIDPRGEVRGFPHDESAYIFAKARRAAGHAGLFSTTGDLLKFGKALLNGTYPAIREGAQKGLGWQTSELNWMGAGSNGFGKTGFTGTSIIVHPAQKKALVILSNRTYPKRGDITGINNFRKDIADIVFSAS